MDLEENFHVDIGVQILREALVEGIIWHFWLLEIDSSYCLSTQFQFISEWTEKEHYSASDRRFLLLKRLAIRAVLWNDLYLSNPKIVRRNKH